MGVYIDMEMPQEGFVEILVRSDGTVQQTGQSYRIDETDYYTPYVGEMPVMYEAVPVPPHGRLIDADAFLALINDSTILSDFLKCIIKPLIRGEPTVIEAEEGE